MTTALDPPAAVGYLSLLSADVMTVGVHGAAGELLAGERVDPDRGTTVSATSGALTIDATVGPHSLRGLLDYDLQVACAELAK